MEKHLLMKFKNEEGDRQNIRLNDFDDSLTSDELREEMEQILESGVLVGKHGPLNLIVAGKIVMVEEDILVQG